MLSTYTSYLVYSVSQAAHYFTDEAAGAQRGEELALGYSREEGKPGPEQGKSEPVLGRGQLPSTF